MGSSNVRVFPASTQVPPIVTELEAIFAELPDEDLIAKLKGNRRLGRPGYDPAKLWRAFVVYYYMGLPSVSDLIRTLYDNPYIASVCGFASPDEIPHQSTFSRFGSKLAKPKFTLAVKNIVRSFTRRFYEELPGFGKSVAIDSTDIKGWSSAAKARAGNAADKDAGWVVKLGTDGRKKYVWGYKVHILCDTTWELPLAVDTSAGNVHDLKKATPLLAQARYAHSKFNPDYVICDAAYSDRKLRSTIRWQYWARSLSEKQCSKRYASLVECKDANYSTTKSRLL